MHIRWKRFIPTSQMHARTCKTWQISDSTGIYRDGSRLQKENRQLILSNAEKLGIPIHIFDSNIFETVNEITKSHAIFAPECVRGYLYRFARELGCNKIALGHHFDDVIETILMSMLFGGEFKTMMPKLHSAHFEGMELIRPLYYVHEKAIITWKNAYHLNFLNCACKFTDLVEKEEKSSKRLVTKQLIASLKEQNPFVENNIFKSVEKVNLNTPNFLPQRRSDDTFSRPL